MIRFMIGFMSLILTVGIVEGAESFTIANLSLIMTTTIVGITFMLWGITSQNI